MYEVYLLEDGTWIRSSYPVRLEIAINIAADWRSEGRVAQIVPAHQGPVA